MTEKNDHLKSDDNSGAILTVSGGTADGKQFFLNRRLNSIGKDENNTICISGKKVGANHACILFKQGTYTLKNLGKPTTTFVNDSAVTSECSLSTGDRIAVGDVEFRFVASQMELLKDSDGTGHEKTLVDFIKDKAETQLLETFSSLIDITAVLLAENDVSRVVSRLIEVIARVMQCDGVRVLMVSGGSTLKTLAVFPFNSDENSYSRTAIEHAGTENRTVLVSDIESDRSLPAQESMMLKDIRSILCAPLKGDDAETIGYLYLDRLKGQKTFVDTDRDFFERLRGLFGNILLSTLHKENQAATIRQLQQQAYPGASIMYQSDIMNQTMDTALKYANSEIPILIGGETGTGKELLARFIHQASDRKNRAFIAINCAAIPENLIESELFGHEKGAFTGAVAAKKGQMVAADGGTFFMDEIGELDYNLQVKLLRVLQQKEVTPVGALTPIPINIRIIAATNRDLQEEVAAGRFRSDLYFRIRAACITLPPLRNRGHDILLLAHFFINRFAQQYGLKPKVLSKSAEKELLVYPWPGNIRELENKIQAALLVAERETLKPDDFNFSDVSESTLLQKSLKEIREDAEKAAVLRALKKNRGNVSQTSAMLQVDRVVLIRMLKKFEINPALFKT